MLRIFSAIIALLATFGVIILIAGYVTPESYSGSTTITFDYRTEMMWQEIADFEDIERRKGDVESVEILEQFGRRVAWKETLKNGGYRIYRTNEYDTNRKLVIELIESTYGLTGIWIFELFAEGPTTKVIISEESTLTDIKRRGMRRLFGRDKDLLIWIKYIKVGITETLLRTP